MELMAKKRGWTNDEINDIINRYVNLKQSTLKIASFYEVFSGTISRLLKKNNVLINNTTNKKYDVNQYYFDAIDTPAKAYWLGMITADGNVYKNSLNLGLQIVDTGHIYKFRNALESNHPINNYGGSCVCQIHSKYLVNSLGSCNIIPRKCKTVTMPKLDIDLESHFWRGVFDGDGTIGYRVVGQQRKNWYIGIVGNPFLLEQFSHFVKGVCKTKATVRQKETAYSFSVNGNIITPQLANALYADSLSETRLDRKYEKYLKMKLII